MTDTNKTLHRYRAAAKQRLATIRDETKAIQEVTGKHLAGPGPVAAEDRADG